VQKTGSMGAEVMLCGRLFQSRLPATGKARSPMVTSRIDRTVSGADNDECRYRQLVSATRRMISVCVCMCVFSWINSVTLCIIDQECSLFVCLQCEDGANVVMW